MKDDERVYSACPRCTAKWFAPVQLDACPRCGAEGVMHTIAVPPWLRAKRRSSEAEKDESSPRESHGQGLQYQENAGRLS